MKKTVLITLLAFIAIACFGQNDNSGPIKFLGIPIDGTESQFAGKLKNKGFSYNYRTQSYEGQFNGSSVNVLIHCNHDVVDRIFVAFPYKNETEIRIEFNNLIHQFNDNMKYLDLSLNDEISEDDRIGHNIFIEKKRYQASFYYFDNSRDSLEIMNAMADCLSDYISEDLLEAYRKEMEQFVEASEDQQNEIIKQTIDDIYLGLDQFGADEEYIENFYDTLQIVFDSMKQLADGCVWFMIHEHSGRYQIGLYYDNLHNRPHGEDL